MEKTRKCLKCGKKFLSTNIGNRICPDCKRGRTPEFSVPAAVRQRAKKRLEKFAGKNWSGLFIESE